MSSFNPRLIIVGNGSADFDRIQDAIDAIGSTTRYPPPTAESRYTILVTPGIYREKIIFKHKFVDLVGISQHSVYIQPDATDGAIIELFDDVTVSNVTVWNFRNEYAIRGRGVQAAGLNRVEIWARPIDRQKDDFVLSTAKALRMEGRWTAFITRFFGASYYGTEDYSVELVGPDPAATTVDPITGRRPPGWTYRGWNADCHLIDSFFDSLSISDQRMTSGVPVGGCVYIRDCYEVHVRNSLVRTTGEGAAVRIEAASPSRNRNYPDSCPYMRVDRKAPLVAASIEGSTLEAPTRALSIADYSLCFFRHSAASSIDIDKQVERVGRGRLLNPGWHDVQEALERG
jgi:hypothetical protein